MKHVVILICFLCVITGRAQVIMDSTAVMDTTKVLGGMKVTKDSTKITKQKKDRRPRNAAILSAILPGAGQIYNGRWWKAPIVWAGLGVTGYYFMKNQDLYTQYRNDVKASVSGNTAAVVNKDLSLDNLQSLKIFHRKRRDIFGFCVIATYAIQIIDANVDAHLRTFDVSDDLSLEVQAKPVYAGAAIGAGLGLKLNFK